MCIINETSIYRRHSCNVLFLKTRCNVLVFFATFFIFNQRSTVIVRITVILKYLGTKIELQS